MAVASVLTGGMGILAYLVAWVIIPSEDQQASVADNVISRTRHV